MTYVKLDKKLDKLIPAWGNLKFGQQDKIRILTADYDTSKQQQWTRACSIYEAIRAMIKEQTT